MGKTPGEKYAEREKRVTDTIKLKVPDRVPVIITWSYFPASNAGTLHSDAFYDAARWKTACKKATLDFEPDMCRFTNFFPGTILEALDYKQTKWPGHGLSPNHSHQFVEKDYMKADEYDAFFKDPSDYLLRTYLPRLCGSLEHLQALPPLNSILSGYHGVAEIASVFASPEFSGVIEALLKSGKEMLKYRSEIAAISNELEGLGCPIMNKSVTFAPFDMISDYLRGMRESMLDMFRRPDKILEACEKLLPVMIEKGVSVAKKSGNPRIFIPLHRGAEGFMSLEQYETFYWPTLKRLMLALVDEGLTPCPFFEGDYTSRLEYLLELPKGKIMGHFDASDIFRAKEVLKDHMCIRGNVPSSVLCVASPPEVTECCKKLIDVVGKGGGFILSPGSSIDDAKPENVKAMVDCAKEYGLYG